jgi:phospholipase C
MKKMKTLRLSPLVAAMASVLMMSAVTYAEEASETTTPIKHVIVIVGENHTFDNLYGAYKPKAGQTIDNLLSKGIVKEDGTPGTVNLFFPIMSN